MRWTRSGSQGLSEYPPRPRHEIKGRSGVAQAFFRGDPEDPAPLIVVYHIQKTAGTSLRRVVRANLPPADVEVIPNLSPSARTPARLLESYRTWYESLDEARRARLCCVMSHWAGYLLPALDRPADALALVREPADRTLSYYHFKQRRRGPERPLEPLEQLYETGAGGRADLMAQLCNWQSRALLSVFHDVSELEHSAGPPVDADLWRARLRELVEHVFLVGVQDRFEQYVDVLVRRYGWKAFVPHSKVNPQRPPLSEVSSELRETILAYNWLDAELYELCREIQLRREAEEEVRDQPGLDETLEHARMSPGQPARSERGPWVREVGSTPPLTRTSDRDAAAEYRTVLAHRLEYLERVDQPLVLIAQVARSGGTLLLRLFDGHRQCHVVPYELQRIFRGMASDLSRERAWEHLASDKQYNRSRPFLLRPGLQRAIFEACLGELSDPGPREVMNCFFTSYFNGWLDNANLRSTPKRWVVGFEPGETTTLDAYTRLYPDGRVISIVRDPWSWYASHRKKQRTWGNLELALDAWQAHVTAALRLRAEDPERVMLVPFSELLDSTEATMKSLARWLDISFEPTLVLPSFNGMAIGARSSFSDVGAEISVAPLERGAVLSPEETSHIEQRARDLYEQAMASAVALEPESARRLG